MNGPVSAQFVQERPGQRDDAVTVPLAVADEELVLRARDVVDGQSQAFAQAQAATVDELDRSAIAAQADEADEIAHLSLGKHGGQSIVIPGADLGEERPIGALEQIDEEHPCRGGRLADGLGLPVLLEFDEEEVVPQLASEMLAGSQCR